MILSSEDILRYLPHRDPFLFIDEVVSIEEGNKIHAAMHVKENSVFLEGHFPGNPIVPGVILIEAMGQASGILGFKTMNKTPDDGSIYVIAGVDKALVQPVGVLAHPNNEMLFVALGPANRVAVVDIK